MNWVKQSACAGLDTDIFYPEGKQEDNGMWSKPDWTSAKKVCYNCPVSRQCLEYALITKEEHGVWGGYTPNERRAMQRSGSKQTSLSIETGSRNSLDLTAVDSILARMDSGKPLLGRSRSAKPTSP